MPQPAGSGSTWPHGRGADPGNLGRTETPPGLGQALAEIRSRPHFFLPGVDGSRPDPNNAQKFTSWSYRR